MKNARIFMHDDFEAVAYIKYDHGSHGESATVLVVRFYPQTDDANGYQPAIYYGFTDESSEETGIDRTTAACNALASIDVDGLNETYQDIRRVLAEAEAHADDDDGD